MKTWNIPVPICSRHWSRVKRERFRTSSRIIFALSPTSWVATAPFSLSSFSLQQHVKLSYISWSVVSTRACLLHKTNLLYHHNPTGQKMKKHDIHSALQSKTKNVHYIIFHPEIKLQEGGKKDIRHDCCKYFAAYKLCTFHSLSLFLLTKSLNVVKEVLKNAFIKKLGNIDVKLSV